MLVFRVLASPRFFLAGRVCPQWQFFVPTPEEGGRWRVFSVVTHYWDFAMMTRV